MATDCRAIGVISIKGGVGKTTCAVNLGAALAKNFNQKTLVIDANYSAPNLGLHLGMVNPEVTLNDVFRKGIHMSNAVYKYHDNLHIVPCSLAGRKINVNELKTKISSIKQDYDIVLIDSSPNINHEMLSAIAASDELLIVTTPDYPTLSTTIHAVKVAKRKNMKINGLVLNRVRNKKFELGIEDIEQASETQVLAVIQDDARILEALALAKPVAFHRPMSNASISYNKLAASLIGEDYTDPRFVSRIKSIFSPGIPKDELNRMAFKNERNK